MGPGRKESDECAGSSRPSHYKPACQICVMPLLLCSPLAEEQEHQGQRHGRGRGGHSHGEFTVPQTSCQLFTSQDTPSSQGDNTVICSPWDGRVMLG